MAKRSRSSKKGGTWYDPRTWFQAAPETVPEETQPTAPATIPETPVTETEETNINPTGARRKTRRGGRRGVKKTRSGKKSNRH